MELTTQEAMRELRICRNTLTKLIRSGEIAAYKTGTYRNSGFRISEESIRAFKQRQSTSIKISA